MRRTAVAILLILGLGTPAGGNVAEPAAAPADFDDCDAGVRDEAENLESYACYWSMARRLRAWPEAVRRLEALLAVEPDNARAKLYLGAVEADRYQDRAESLYREALESFIGSEAFRAEVYARVSLEYFLRARGRHDEADSEMDAAHLAATASGEAGLVARVETRQGWRAYHLSDYGRAAILFRRAEQRVFPSGPADVRVQALDGLGAVNWATGRPSASLEYYRREADLLRQAGDLSWEAGVRNNIALLAGQVFSPRTLSEEELRSLTEEALDAAVRAQNVRAEAGARLLLGQLLEGVERTDQFDRAMALARSVGDSGKLVDALNRLAFERAASDPSDPGPAYALADQALDLVKQTASPAGLAGTLAIRATIGFLVGPRDRAVADGLAALDAVERIRELQPDEQVRAGTFARWVGLYHKFAYYLAMGPDGLPPTEEDLELAFEVLERMRSRVLLDSLDSAGASGVADTTRPEWSERDGVLQEIARVQRGLLDPRIEDDQRRRALAELERLELQETMLRDSIARHDPAFARLRVPELTSLSELRRSLDPDQAFAMFQIGREQTPGLRHGLVPWMLCVTKDRVTVHEIGSEAEIAWTVRFYLGLVQRRDDSERGGAVALYRALLDEALDQAGPQLRSLVIVPDGPLHRIPFGALLESAEAQPLAVSLEISIAPSASVWTRLGGASPRPVGAGVFSMADPVLPASRGRTTGLRDVGSFADVMDLAPLPRARHESRAVARALGKPSLLAEGGQASEHRLKSSEIGRHGVLHLAVHAVIDEAHPRRSSLVLAPGDDNEDGLVQMREIVDLPLEGKIVILSACSSASGPMVAGEGVMGLARSFFQAGATAVVGSLWPLRDDEAEEITSRFARFLGDGHTVGEALALTRRESIRAGAPTGEWAGFVAIGTAECRVGPVP